MDQMDAKVQSDVKILILLITFKLILSLFKFFIYQRVQYKHQLQSDHNGSDYSWNLMVYRWLQILSSLAYTLSVTNESQTIISKELPDKIEP